MTEKIDTSKATWELYNDLVDALRHAQALAKVCAERGSKNDYLSDVSDTMNQIIKKGILCGFVGPTEQEEIDLNLANG